MTARREGVVRNEFRAQVAPVREQDVLAMMGTGWERGFSGQTFILRCGAVSAMVYKGEGTSMPYYVQFMGDGVSIPEDSSRVASRKAITEVAAQVRSYH